MQYILKNIGKKYSTQYSTKVKIYTLTEN